MTDREWAAKIVSETTPLEGDTEAVHEVADGILTDLLLSLGYTETVAAWEALPKWYA